MYKAQVSGAIAAAILLLAGGSVLASPCSNSCTTKFTACQKGANPGACQSTWMKCRKQCTGGVAQPTASRGMSSTPTTMHVGMGQGTTAKTATSAKAH